MMRDQVPDAFIAALRWEGVPESQIDAALTRVEGVRLGQDWSWGDEEIRDYAFEAGARFRDVAR